MKPVLTFLLLCVALIGVTQPLPTPTVPEQATFADLTVRFDADARRMIQQDVNALMNNRQYWNAKLDRALLHFPIIENILLTEQIPTDFKYLALQESSLTPDAVSSSQAVGYWQFKRETAENYGMVVNEEVDERKNISSSTRAAAKYLRRSYGMYMNWVSALYSFYLGTGGISKIVAPEWANSRDITLDSRTDRYILRFFAHKLAVEYALRAYQPTNTFSLVEYNSGAGKTINEIADELKLNASDIRNYNRWLLIDHIPADKPYVVIIPTPNGQINDLRQRIAQTTDKPLKTVVTDDIGFPVLKRVTAANSPANEAVLYEINGLPGIQAQAGDNAGTLSRKARISLASFLRFNDLSENEPLLAGEVYYLSRKRKKALVPFHTARADETMRSISQRYAIRLKKLLRFNRMDRVQKLQVGRVLWLRERRPAKKPIEVITSPTPPVYDNSPATPTTRPVAGRTTDLTISQGPNAIPRNASERRRYEPKLVGSATPTAPTDEQTTRPNAGATTVRSGAGNVPLNRPAAPTPTVTTTTVPNPDKPTETVEVAVTPRDAGSPQRTIIVRSEGESVRERTTPARSAPGASTQTPDIDMDAPAPTRPTVSPSGTVSTRSETSQPQATTQPIARSTQPVDRSPLPRDQIVSIPPLPPMTTDAPPAPTTDRGSAGQKTAGQKTAGQGASGRGRTVTHMVEAGQTFYSLARYYGVSVNDLLTANDLTMNDRLSVGQTLTINNVPTGYPTGQATTAPRTTAPTTPGQSTLPVSAPPVAETPAGQPTYHTVGKGETLYRVSRQYNVSVDQLVQWNNLPNTIVKEGQRLKVSP